MNILIAEPLAAAGVELLKAQAGWNVVVSNPKEYLNHLPEADALVVRSAVKVTREVLEKAPKLRVIGRAGVGVDNVDLNAATAAGGAGPRAGAKGCARSVSVEADGASLAAGVLPAAGAALDQGAPTMVIASSPTAIASDLMTGLT